MNAFEVILKCIEENKKAEAKELLDKANSAFYNSGTSQLTDAEYDTLSDMYKSKFSEEIKTGARLDRQASVPHDWPLLSGWLDKAATLEDGKEWLTKRTLSTKHTGDPELIYSAKWDGLSIVISYAPNGAVVKALTRGENGFGVDVTRLFKGEKHFGNDFVESKGFFGVKYEVVMGWSDVERLSEATNKAYSNPRNTVAGIVSSDDSATKRDYITLVPLDIQFELESVPRIERLAHIQRLFTTDDNQRCLFTGNGNHETPFVWVASWENSQANFEEFYHEVAQLRSDPEFDFMLDGVVIEFHSDAAISTLGNLSSDCPDYAVAVKFPHMVGRTEVVSLEWDLGNTGRLTPCVVYKPVTLDGRTFTRTSIANMTRFDILKLAPGTPIIIEIRGDILAWVDRDGPDPEGAVPFPEPENATYTYNGTTRVFAYAPEAPLAGRCERMLVKCNVKGIKIETINKLVEGGLINQLSDMWTFSEEEAKVLPGLGEVSIDAISRSLKRKLADHLWDWEILASVGISSFGNTLARQVLQVFTLDEMLNASDETRSSQLAELTSAIGPERAAIVLNGIIECRYDIESLMSIDPKYKASKDVGKPTYDGPKYKVVVTGDLNDWDRDELKNVIELMGHKMVGSISSKTDFLITNTPESGTVKNREATAKGVRIVTEKEAIKLLGVSALPKKHSRAFTGDETPNASVDLESM